MQSTRDTSLGGAGRNSTSSAVVTSSGGARTIPSEGGTRAISASGGNSRGSTLSDTAPQGGHSGVGTDTSVAAAGRASLGGASSMSIVNSGGNTASATSGASTCPEKGQVTYTLAQAAAPTAAQQAAYDKITAAMNKALEYYNCYTNITKSLNVSYVPDVPTADGNINGSIRFGSQASMNFITAMHEIGHTVGVGTSGKWSSFVVDSKFTGPNAVAQLLLLPSRTRDTIGADKQHFWPFGLNYESEGKDPAELLGHCKMVMAIRKDLGMP